MSGFGRAFQPRRKGLGYTLWSVLLFDGIAYTDLEVESGFGPAHVRHTDGRYVNRNV